MNATKPQRIDRRRERGDRSRQAVLDCAIALASVEGLEALTFGRLASDVGVGKSNLTVLFGDKESLQLATIDASVTRMVESFIESALRKKTALGRLEALCDGWFESIRPAERPGGCFMYATAHEYRARRGALHDRATGNLTRWRKLLAKQLRDAKKSGEVASGVDVSSAILTLVAYQNTAHLARTTGDEAMFADAWRLSREYLRSLHARKG